MSTIDAKPDMSSERYADRSDNVTMMNWGSRLEYLARCVLVCHPRSLVIMVATHKGTLSSEELDAAKKKLQEQLIPTLEKHTGRKVYPDVLCINAEDQKELLHLKETIEEIFVKLNKETQNIPLTWIFLRTALYSSGPLAITKSQLKKYAGAYGIRDWTFETFLKTFTDLGSILYIPEIPPLRNNVIIEPMEFINTLCHVFYPPASEEDALKYGLITQEALQDMLGENTTLIVEILSAISLLVKLNKFHIYKGQSPNPSAVRPMSSHRKAPPYPSLADFVPRRAESQIFYYVPDARVHKMVPLVRKPNSLYIDFTLLYTPPDLQSFFVRYILPTFDSSSLVPITECNVTKIVVPFQDHMIDITFTAHGRTAELNVATAQLRYIKSLCKKVVQAFASSLQQYKKFHHNIDCTYYLCCLKDIKDPRSSTQEVITSDACSSLCRACLAQSKAHPYRNEWISAVKSVGSCFIEVVS